MSGRCTATSWGGVWIKLLWRLDAEMWASGNEEAGAKLVRSESTYIKQRRSSRLSGWVRLSGVRWRWQQWLPEIGKKVLNNLWFLVSQILVHDNRSAAQIYNLNLQRTTSISWYCCSQMIVTFLFEFHGKSQCYAHVSWSFYSICSFNYRLFLSKARMPDAWCWWTAAMNYIY